jgi:hypothetical protein
MGMTSGLLVLTYVPIAAPFVPRTDAMLVAIVVVVLAILAWARWQLRAHTIPEIALGTIMGFVATAAAAYGYQLLFL